jgi:Holliday junction resolvase
VTTNYRRGADVERLIVAELEADGYWPVVRSAGSKGVVDLIAQKDGLTIAVQVKRSMWPGVEERRALAMVAARTRWIVLAARWEPRRPTRWATIDTEDAKLVEVRRA